MKIKEKILIKPEYYLIGCMLCYSISCTSQHSREGWEAQQQHGEKNQLEASPPPEGEEGEDGAGEALLPAAQRQVDGQASGTNASTVDFSGPKGVNFNYAGEGTSWCEYPTADAKVDEALLQIIQNIKHKSIYACLDENVWHTANYTNTTPPALATALLQAAKSAKIIDKYQDNQLPKSRLTYGDLQNITSSWTDQAINVFEKGKGGLYPHLGLLMDRDTKIALSTKKNTASRISPLYKDPRVKKICSLLQSHEYKKACEQLLQALIEAVPAQESISMRVSTKDKPLYEAYNKKKKDKAEVPPTADMVFGLALYDLILLNHFAQKPELLDAAEKFQFPDKNKFLEHLLRAANTALLTVQEVKKIEELPQMPDDWWRFKGKALMKQAKNGRAARPKQYSVIYLNKSYYEKAAPVDLGVYAETQQVFEADEERKEAEDNTLIDSAESTLVYAKIGKGFVHEGKTLYVGTCHAGSKGTDAWKKVATLREAAYRHANSPRYTAVQDRPWLVVSGDMNVATSATKAAHPRLNKHTYDQFKAELKTLARSSQFSPDLVIMHYDPAHKLQDAIKKRLLSCQVTKLGEFAPAESYQLIVNQALIEAIGRTLVPMPQPVLWDEATRQAQALGWLQKQLAELDGQPYDPFKYYYVPNNNCPSDHLVVWFSLASLFAKNQRAVADS